MQQSIYYNETFPSRVCEDYVVTKRFDERRQRRVIVREPLAELRHDARSRHQFLERGRRLQRVRSPHVIQVYTIQAGTPDTPCSIMCEDGGEFLDELLPRAPLESGLLRTILAGALEGLAAAHRAGVTPVSLSPGSIVYSPQGGAKLVDIHTAWEGPQPQRGTLVLETLKYVAPESCLHDGRIGIWSALYSLGCLGYELGAGSAQYHQVLSTATIAGEYVPTSLYQMWHCDPTLSFRPLHKVNRNIDRTLSRVVSRLTEKNLNARYATPEEALRDLVPSTSPRATDPVAAAGHDGLTLAGVIVFGVLLFVLLASLA